MAKKVITTVGASLFANYRDKNKVIRNYALLSKEYDSIDVQCKNVEDLVSEERRNSKYTSDINHIKSVIEDLWLSSTFAGEKASAEIETLYKIAKDEGKDLDVYLLATDTVLSVVACELIKEWFEKYPSVKLENEAFSVTIKCHFHGDIHAPDTTVVKGLQMNDVGIFKTIGFQKLLEILKKRSDKDTIFNISGGYKAIIPFMTLYAQLKNIELRYMYEDSDELMKVGNLPIQFDWAVGELYYDFICDDEIRASLETSNPIYTTLFDYELIYANKVLTPLGLLFQDYINAKMPEAKGTFGFYAEYKVYESFIENPYADFIQPKRSVDYYWSNQDKTVCSSNEIYKNDAVHWEPIEIDLVLKNAQNHQIWAEIKPFSEKGLNKARKQIEKRLLFNEQVKKCDGQLIDFQVKSFFLIVYKFDFQDIDSKKRQIEAIKKLFEMQSIDLKIFYFDVPVNLDKDKINYKAFFDKPILLKSIY